jgi:hypothetical protein
MNDSHMVMITMGLSKRQDGLTSWKTDQWHMMNLAEVAKPRQVVLGTPGTGSSERKNYIRKFYVSVLAKI